MFKPLKLEKLLPLKVFFEATITIHNSLTDCMAFHRGTSWKYAVGDYPSRPGHRVHYTIASAGGIHGWLSQHSQQRWEALTFQAATFSVKLQFGFFCLINAEIVVYTIGGVEISKPFDFVGGMIFGDILAWVYLRGMKYTSRKPNYLTWVYPYIRISLSHQQ